MASIAPGSGGNLNIVTSGGTLGSPTRQLVSYDGSATLDAGR